MNPVVEIINNPNPLFRKKNLKKFFYKSYKHLLTAGLIEKLGAYIHDHSNSKQQEKKILFDLIKKSIQYPNALNIHLNTDDIIDCYYYDFTQCNYTHEIRLIFQDTRITLKIVEKCHADDWIVYKGYFMLHHSKYTWARYFKYITNKKIKILHN